MSASSAAPAAAPAPIYQVVPLAELIESGLNPRRRFDERRLDELAASMKPPVGILEPLLVRPSSRKVAPRFEIVAGARRFRAAQRAGLEVAPVLVRVLTDAQVLELMVIENNQRQDVHPLEEADGYAKLMKLDRAYTVEAIAAKTGKSASYIYRRLKLRELIPAARKAFEADELTAAHAERLARLTKDQQATALKDACFYPLFGHADFSADDQGPGKRDVQPVSKLDEWIAHHVRLQVDSPDVPAYFPELAQARAEGPQQPDQEAGAVPRMLELSESYQPGAQLHDKKHGALPRRRWVEIGAKEPWTRKVVKPCEHAEQGVVVHGGRVRVLTVCATKGCRVHWPEKKKSKAANTRARAAASQQRWERESAERERKSNIRHAYGHTLQDTIADRSAGLKLDGRVLTIVGKYLLKERVTVKALPGALVRAAAEDCGTWQVEDLEKIAKAIGINPKPLRAAAEAKFPKKG